MDRDTAGLERGGGEACVSHSPPPTFIACYQCQILRPVIANQGSSFSHVLKKL